MIGLEVKVKRWIVNVAVSGIIMQTDSNELEQKRREANELIRRGLHHYKIHHSKGLPETALPVNPCTTTTEIQFILFADSNPIRNGITSFTVSGI